MAKIAYATVGDLIADRVDLTTFNNLLRRSHVIAEVDGEGPFTLLAPTNAAFDRLPQSSIGFLVEHPDRLHRAMAHHVVDGEYPTAGVFEPMSWPSLLDEPISVMPAEKGLVIGSALVVEPDLRADNGLVHVIDAVLLPE